MPVVEDYSVKRQSIQIRLTALEHRQRRLMGFSLAALTFAIIALVTWFYREDLSYGLLNISSSVQQLHWPRDLSKLEWANSQSDYLTRLISWFGWLLLKVVVSLLGAFWFFKQIRRLRFVKQRSASVFKRLLLWLISFILIWSGLSYIQQSRQNDRQELDRELVAYEQNIQQSKIAMFLADSNVAPPVQDYMLAQAALLHRPADRNTALHYLSQLVIAERQDPNFLNYGFSAHQLMSMQMQVYGHALTPVTQQLEPKLRQAQTYSAILNVFSLVFAAIAAGLAILFYLLSRYLSKTANRIRV